MSLSDPQWGPGSDEDEKKKRADKDAERSQERDENAGRDEERDAPRQRPEPPKGDDNDDIEAIWKKFSSLFGGDDDDAPKPRAKRNASKLMSRDDFSRPDANDEPGVASPSDARRAEEPRPEFEDDDPWAIRPKEKKPSDRPRFGGGNGGGRGPADGFMRVFQGGSSFLTVLILGGYLATGFYIVPEGKVGVVTTFGKYSGTTQPGFRWHMPLPIEDVRLVDISSVRTVDIGGPGRQSESLMLTDDENIVDMSFSVQYRIKPDGAKSYVFDLRKPDATVQQAAESAMREVVGRRTMDSVLFESKAEIANDVRRSMQAMLDRYHSGIEVMSVAIQNAQPPEPVQAAFNDAVKAGQDRERQINLGEAYRNAVLPKAQGTASRMKEEALGYQARVTEAANGDAARFTALYNQYKLAPTVTRDRMYIDAVETVLKNVSKVYMDEGSKNSLMFLPLDKLMGDVKKTAPVVNHDGSAPAPAPTAESTDTPTLNPNPFNRSNRLGSNR